jgi:hypothetical protein
MICVTELGIAMQAAEKTARHPVTGQFRSEAARQHGITSDGRMNYQPPTTPVPVSRLATATGAEGALMSSIAEHQGTAEVGRLDAASAASPGLAGALGRNYPSGILGQPAPHVAPTGVGARFRLSPGRQGGF